MINDSKILIVGNLPFFKGAQSREFESYFSLMPEKSLRQIYFSSTKPVKCQCAELFQLTDRMVAKRFFNKKNEGVIYFNKDLPNENDYNGFKPNDPKIFSVFKKNTILKRILRNVIWKKRRWLTDKLAKWADDFSPNIIFLSWSNDIFVLEMADYFSKKYNAPIIISISDDYLFNKDAKNVLKRLFYYAKYVKKAKSILTCKKNKVFFIDDKICRFYSDYFKIDGLVIHVGTNLNNHVTNYPKGNKFVFSYFGQLSYHRYETIYCIGDYLEKNYPGSQIKVFTKKTPRKAKLLFKSIKKTILSCGYISYNKIQEQSNRSDFILVVESLKNKKSISNVRFSLSTKFADSLGSGKIVFASGNIETGMMNYATRNECCITATTHEEIKKRIDEIFLNKIDYKNIGKNAALCLKNDFSILNSSKKFNDLVCEVLKNG